MTTPDGILLTIAIFASPTCGASCSPSLNGIDVEGSSTKHLTASDLCKSKHCSSYAFKQRPKFASILLSLVLTACLTVTIVCVTSQTEIIPNTFVYLKMSRMAVYFSVEKFSIEQWNVFLLVKENDVYVYVAMFVDDHVRVGSTKEDAPENPIEAEGTMRTIANALQQMAEDAKPKINCLREELAKKGLKESDFMPRIIDCLQCKDEAEEKNEVDSGSVSVRQPSIVDLMPSVRNREELERLVEQGDAPSVGVIEEASDSATPDGASRGANDIDVDDPERPMDQHKHSGQSVDEPSSDGETRRKIECLEKSALKNKEPTAYFQPTAETATVYQQIHLTPYNGLSPLYPMYFGGPPFKQKVVATYRTEHIAEICKRFCAFHIDKKMRYCHMSKPIGNTQSQEARVTDATDQLRFGLPYIPLIQMQPPITDPRSPDPVSTNELTRQNAPVYLCLPPVHPVASPPPPRASDIQEQSSTADKEPPTATSKTTSGTKHMQGETYDPRNRMSAANSGVEEDGELNTEGPLQVTDATTTEMETTVTEQVPTTIPTEERMANDEEIVQQFVCKRMMQSVPIEKRCDNVPDCEDGTDEEDCKCKDVLKGNDTAKICDGSIDCFDASDEEGCGICKPNEFHCVKSNACVQKSQRCNEVSDCTFGEDEMDCYVLTNGEHVNLDLDDRPHLNAEGVLTSYQNGSWRATCLKPEARNDSGRSIVGLAICHKLGFSNTEVGPAEGLPYDFYSGVKGVDSMKEIVVRTSKMSERSARNGSSVAYEYPPQYTAPAESDWTCFGVYIRCKPILNSTMSNFEVVKSGGNGPEKTYAWPWEASVFVDGRYRCSALLLEEDLLLGPAKCGRGVNLSKNYTVASVGAPPLNFPFSGPYEQISRVVDIKPLRNSVASVFRLRDKINMTRYAQPINLDRRIFPASSNDTCIAVGVNDKGVKKTRLLRTILDCPPCRRCFIERSPSLSCSRSSGASKWSGHVVCLSKLGWYPAAVFQNRDLICGFGTTQTLNGIDYLSAHVSQAIGEATKPLDEPTCLGLRCTLGRCIPWDRVCDGARDCQDGKDEEPKYCRNSKGRCDKDGANCRCHVSELRCGDGQCIPKQGFCDGRRDCSDGSDEPAGCSCARYLSLSRPNLVCDGRRHCFDKSDESYKLCACADSSFRCTGSPYNGTVACVPQDYVCDGHPDCPNGEDEAREACWKLQSKPGDPKGKGEVMRRSYGVLQSLCLPQPTMSRREAGRICKELGFAGGAGDKKIKLVTDAQYELRYDFFMVQVNSMTWVSMRPNATLGVWKRPEADCYRAFVHCA
ncbi:serine protease nudel-like [Copidosoma floridanum]|uniref:serine protease nudel-like n=1 Tax=Copidosoma floridanum TaxID=29053 RepID=UPI000C6FC79C|nr:serine protease nudel-like [Copidosoma floridanum]